MSNWSTRYASDNKKEISLDVNGQPMIDSRGEPYGPDSPYDPRLESRNNPWHPFNTEEEAMAEISRQNDEFAEQEHRRDTHARNYKYYQENFAQKGLAKTQEAIDYYREKVVPFKD